MIIVLVLVCWVALAALLAPVVGRLLAAAGAGLPVPCRPGSLSDLPAPREPVRLG